MAELYDKIQETVDFLKQRIGAARPKIAIILGSGLGALGDQIEDAVAIPYAEIPNFPSSDVKGHKNRLIVGRLEDKEVIALQGRFHFYEGYTMEQCTFPVRIFKGLGVEALFVSNAAGGLNPSFEVSDLMLIEDVINLTGTNPLRGPNDDRLGTRFPDMLNLFDAGLQKIAAELADERGFALRRGRLHGPQRPHLRDPRRGAHAADPRHGRGGHVHGARGHGGAPRRDSPGPGHLVHHQRGDGRSAARRCGSCRGREPPGRARRGEEGRGALRGPRTRRHRQDGALT